MAGATILRIVRTFGVASVDEAARKPLSRSARSSPRAVGTRPRAALGRATERAGLPNPLEYPGIFLLRSIDLVCFTEIGLLSQI